MLLSSGTHHHHRHYHPHSEHQQPRRLPRFFPEKDFPMPSTSQGRRGGYRVYRPPLVHAPLAGAAAAPTAAPPPPRPPPSPSVAVDGLHLLLLLGERDIKVDQQQAAVSETREIPIDRQHPQQHQQTRVLGARRSHLPDTINIYSSRILGLVGSIKIIL